MKNLLTALSLGLRIETEDKVESKDTTLTIHCFGYEDRLDGIREIFKKELNKHIFQKLQRRKPGGHIEYMFECGKHRPLGSIMNEANDNLAEVFQKLPLLPEGERYVLPSNTYISLILVEKNKNEVKAKIGIVSEWIKPYLK